MWKTRVPSYELGTSPTMMGCVHGGTPSLWHLLLAIISPASSILITYVFAVLSQAGKETMNVFSDVEICKGTKGEKNKGMSIFPQLTDFTAHTYGNSAKLDSAAILIKY